MDIDLLKTDLHPDLLEVVAVPEDKSARQNLVTQLRNAAKRENLDATIAERQGRIFIALSDDAKGKIPPIERRGRPGLRLSELVERAKGPSS